jgi:hypothetical protein
LYDASAYGDRLPSGADSSGRDRTASAAPSGVFFIPMYQREALWIGFRGAPWRPNAVVVSTGGVNAVSGQTRASGGETALADLPQNYIVAPPQPWLDGFNTGDGTIRQFVAMPLGLGYSVEAAVTGEERFGRIRLAVFEPRPGRFPDEPPAEPSPEKRPMAGMGAGRLSGMGLGAGGVMEQRIYPDPYGLDAWDPRRCAVIDIHIVNSLQFRDIADEDPPPTPIDAAAYTRHGLPWFTLYDETLGDLPRAAVLARAKTVRERDAERGIDEAADAVDVTCDQVEKIEVKKVKK